MYTPLFTGAPTPHPGAFCPRPTLLGVHRRLNVKIACPSCSARYAIPDEKIEGKVAKIRCRKCSASIEADGRTTPATVRLAAEGVVADEVAAASAPDAAASAPDAAEGAAEVPAGLYSVDLGESDQRNMSLSEIVEAYNNGDITAETYLWADGMADWQPLGEVAEIVDALHAAAESDAAVEAAAAAPVAEAAPEPVFAIDRSLVETDMSHAIKDVTRRGEHSNLPDPRESIAIMTDAER